MYGPVHHSDGEFHVAERVTEAENFVYVVGLLFEQVRVTFWFFKFLSGRFDPHILPTSWILTLRLILTILLTTLPTPRKDDPLIAWFCRWGTRPFNNRRLRRLFQLTWSPKICLGKVSPSSLQKYFFGMACFLRHLVVQKIFLRVSFPTPWMFLIQPHSFTSCDCVRLLA